MNNDDAYFDVVKSYTDGVRMLFTAPGKPTGDRGGRGASTYDELAAQSKTLNTNSAQLTEMAALRLDHHSASVRESASLSLLAKVHTDLDVGYYLLEIAREQEMKREFGRRDTGNRRANIESANEPVLKIIEGIAPVVRSSKRSIILPDNLDTAKTELAQHTDMTLTMITTRAGEACETAFIGLAGVGIGELVQAVSLVGMDIAAELSKAEQVSELFDLFRSFFSRAYDTITSLLGPKLAEMVGDQVLEWLEDYKVGVKAASLLDRFYETETIREEINQKIKTSQVNLPLVNSGLTGVRELNDSFHRQTKLVNSILPKMKFAAVIPTAVLPQGKLIMVSAYICLGGYVAFTAGDYVDAHRLDFFDRVFGLRQVIDSKLGKHNEREK